jgi:uncharacterized protein
MKASNALNDTNETATISCASCDARCCRLEVLLMGDDAVPIELTVEDRWGGQVMRRLDDAWCAAVDRDTMKCTIYERRPAVCRDYPVGESDCLVERSRLAAKPACVSTLRGAAATTDRKNT